MQNYVSGILVRQDYEQCRESLRTVFNYVQRKLSAEISTHCSMSKANLHHWLERSSFPVQFLTALSPFHSTPHCNRPFSHVNIEAEKSPKIKIWIDLRGEKFKKWGLSLVCPCFGVYSTMVRVSHSAEI